MVGSRPTIIIPTNMTERRVATTSVRAFSRSVPKFSESRVGVDKINYQDTFHLFKDKGHTKFEHRVTYIDDFRYVNVEQRPQPVHHTMDGFNYTFHDSQDGTVSIHALSVFTSDLDYTLICMSNGHYSREINLITISMQICCVPGGYGFAASTPEILLSKLESG